MGKQNRKEFPSQKENEQIIFVLRKHWATLSWPVFKSILALLIIFILPDVLGIWVNVFSNVLLTFIFLAWIIFWVNYLIYEYLNWHRDKVIATDTRIVNIDQLSLFKRHVSEVELDQITDVSHEISGLLATTFNYGDVIISSSASDSIELLSVPNPAEVQNLLKGLKKEIGKGNPVTAEELIEFIKSNRKNE